jgi:Chaperone of endosialidase
MKTTTNIIYPAFALFALACFAFSPQARATCQEGCNLPLANTFLGDDALINNTTGVFNTAMGSHALLGNTIGIENTATGVNALGSNTTGSDNTATGLSALISNTTGSANTATGVEALFSNTTGGANTAIGFQALYSNTSAGGDDANTAIGFRALYSNTSGEANNAFGARALLSNISGDRNLAVGLAALRDLTSGDSDVAVGNSALVQGVTVNFNTALGRRALFRTQGDQNIGLGFFVGSNLNGGSNNIFIGNVGPVPIGSESNTIRIGQQTPAIATVGNPPVESHLMPRHTATYIAGISEAAVTGRPVMINSSGKLGVAPSSARFKQDIQSMDKASETILALKPVTFRYKKELDPEGTPQFGLVAEDVEKVNPDLVVRDPDGKVYSVRYDAVNAMLLNEFLKEHRRVQEQAREIQQQKATISELKNGMETVVARLKEQDSRIQRVSAQIEMGRPTKVVLNRP